MKYSVVLLSLLGLLLAGCGHTPGATGQTDLEAAAEIMDEMMDDEMMDDDEEEEMDEEESEEMDDDKTKVEVDAEVEAELEANVTDDHGGWVDEADNQGKYTAYVDGVVGNGYTSVLFFHAEWCPKCKQNDGRLTKYYGEGDYPITTYKIDYDTADELKKIFGVVQQDTFVKIDGNGNVLTSTSFPSEADLKALISA